MTNSYQENLDEDKKNTSNQKYYAKYKGQL